jgi:hypothetical protein
MSKKIIIIGAIITIVVTGVLGYFVFQPGREASQNEWQDFEWEILKFQYPPGWSIEKVFYRTPAQEAADEPPFNVGLIIYKLGEASSTDLIYIGGVQANCQTMDASRCLSFFMVPFYTFSEDQGALEVYDFLVKTVSYNNPNATFKINSPSKDDIITAGEKYTIKWETSENSNISTVKIIVTNSFNYWQEGLILAIDPAINNGSYKWNVPGVVNSSDPYMIRISSCEYTVSTSSCVLRSDWSQPFYINP